MKFGSICIENGVQFWLWAPKCERIAVVIDGCQAQPMNASGNGWHELTSRTAAAGSRYQFVLPDGLKIPDPASRYQPADVHGPSEVIDPQSYAWRYTHWSGLPWAQAVIYELHVGSFTREGTFLAAIERLETLAQLGVTAIELMPVADFPGRRNWGYDGVLLYAPDSSYGRPEDLKALIDAAHGLGLMVFLDVVYNHFGPDGNYLPLYAPVFNDRHKTPWGPAVNYDGEQSQAVRDFIIENAVYWAIEYRFDGLRLDAVHAIEDDSKTHLLDELALRVKRAVGSRHFHLILENDENQASWLDRDSSGAPRRYTAQWNDDVHHVLHVAASGEGDGYYQSYVHDANKLGRALAEGFCFQGEVAKFRSRPRGEPSRHLPPAAFVSFIQNHDQIGNRAFGERLTSIAPKEAVRAIAAVYLLAPQIPMIFMGEEWGCRRPFLFFCDFGEELADKVREGRRAEFARFPAFSDPEKRKLIPDPCDERTFLQSKLDWGEAEQPEHSEWRAFYQSLLRTRRAEIIPYVASATAGGSYQVLGDSAVRVHWQMGDRALTLLANLAPGPCACRLPPDRRIWVEGHIDEAGLGPWTVVWTVR